MSGGGFRDETYMRPEESLTPTLSRKEREKNVHDRRPRKERPTFTGRMPGHPELFHRGLAVADPSRLLRNDVIVTKPGTNLRKLTLMRHEPHRDTDFSQGIS
jgi:hypothetical protein